MAGEKKARGTLYGVGVGPGDPELLTLAAQRVLLKADVIAAPDINGGRRTALGIVRAALGEEVLAGKRLVDCTTPMVRDRAATAAAYDAIADQLAELLDEGFDVAFATLGDPGVYSTYYYVHDRMVSRGYTCEVIAGVTSFSAASARLGRPLCMGPERLVIVPASSVSVEDALDTPGAKVFMKAGRKLFDLRDAIRERGISAGMVADCGMETELVAPDFAAFEGEGSYMAVVIAEGGGQ